MVVKLFYPHLFRFRRPLIFCILFLTTVTLWRFRLVLHIAWSLLSLPLSWNRGSSEFFISQESDGFDVTFGRYSRHQTTAGEGWIDHVPPVIHHIMLGSNAPLTAWNESRQSCLDLHPGWEYHLWTDENAGEFVDEKFPYFRPTWDAYQLPIQRVDAMRYLALYEYGGVILDMDLRCKRSLGPLRRFRFVAPAAFPTGFSISFLMASRHNEFLGTLVQRLKLYDRHWFGLPYITVMFSTGGHFASAVHVQQPNRAQYKILAGPKDNLKLHSLNGPVSTPLFDHLGSSSWHSYDGLIIMALGKYLKWIILLVIIFMVAIVWITGLYSRVALRWRSLGKAVDADVEKRAA